MHNFLVIDAHTHGRHRPSFPRASGHLPRPRQSLGCGGARRSPHPLLGLATIDELRRRMSTCGPQRERLVRSTVNSAALLAMLECGMFDRSPNLNVVVTALALNGAMLSDRFASSDNACRQGYIDTTG